MSKRKILVQLDGDAQPSVFDSVVAIDAEVDHLLRHAGVEVAVVRDLVYGAMFTRGGDDLRSTAIFIGGSNVAAGEAILAAVLRSFFGPVRVSVMLDSNGANTTAAAAVLLAGKHLQLEGAQAAVLARHRAGRLARRAAAGARGCPRHRGFAQQRAGARRLPGRGGQSRRREARRRPKPSRSIKRRLPSTAANCSSRPARRASSCSPKVPART